MKRDWLDVLSQGHRPPTRAAECDADATPKAWAIKTWVAKTWVAEQIKNYGETSPLLHRYIRHNANLTEDAAHKLIEDVAAEMRKAKADG